MLLRDRNSKSGRSGLLGFSRSLSALIAPLFLKAIDDHLLSRRLDDRAIYYDEQE